ncbi:hypothetical protein Q4601_13885 [Shewanella sp. 1_MG-2023]|nr:MULTISPECIES: hypothetical protein [unclassified Shewanella]MDO6613387.1 hypothetical protein [Shewanella sp. 7_MG-2023]MDO6773195.1 hypothetical protein [Shewanella sp. 2_MG-2023]MDO6795397.1 hypothetical protein [Shewanella sp. 1_MG-2023]
MLELPTPPYAANLSWTICASAADSAQNGQRLICPSQLAGVA